MTTLLHDTDIASLRLFRAQTITKDAESKICRLSKKIRRDVLTMVLNANSGHIGGSLSSADIYLMLWLCADVTPATLHEDDRDRIVISHGHTSPGLYSVLGNLGFFDIDKAVAGFRKRDTMFEGHPGSHVPGVEWGSGSLGQGLSVGCGFAMAAKIKSTPNRVFVVMGDGEQQKGQLTEACEFAAKHKLSNLTAIIDVNRLQASGNTKDIMPGDLHKKYAAAGWHVLVIDGHNFTAIYDALKYVSPAGRPVAILADTIMSKGVPFIENNYEYHGRLLSRAQYDEAMVSLQDEDYEMLTDKVTSAACEPVESRVRRGNAISYPAGKAVECRTAAGEAIYDIIRNNRDLPVAVVDCDLMESVKTIRVLKEFPERFIECGIQEHNAATISGALSKAGVLPFFLDFGVFGIDETYGQHRMNDMNGTSLKLIATHCGLDVGEDGKTHQCIDFVALTNNLPGYRLIVPADANQTDRAIRFVASTPGNFVVAMGRSKVPVLTTREGAVCYPEAYHFSYGNAEWIREGNHATVITMGTMVHKAVKAADELAMQDISVGVLNISCPGDIGVADIIRACATGAVITYEDHFIRSGLGSMVASVMAENELSCRFRKMAVTMYGKSCPADEQYPVQHLDAESLKKNILKMVAK